MAKEKTEEIQKIGETFDLLVGYKDGEGEIHTEVEIREIKGSDEEALAEGNIRNNLGKIVTELLYNCVERVGTITEGEVGERKWRKIMDSLYIGDRDLILLELRKLTYGNEMEMQGGCTKCGADLMVDIEMDEIKIEQPAEDVEEIPFTLPRGYRDEDGQIHKKGAITLPRGKDQQVLFNVMRKNPGRANTMLLTKTVTRLGNTKIKAKTFREMGKMDREFLLEKVQESKFGPDFNWDLMCPECGSDITVGINPINFI